MRSSDEAQTDRRRLGRDAAAYAGLGRMTKKFARNNICGLHPSAETRLIRCQGFVLVCWVAVVPAEFGLELGWGFVAERRVQTLGVVDGVDEGADLAAGVVDVGVGSGVDLLLLERLHEAFRLGVVVRIGRPAHADGDLPVLQPRKIGDRGVSTPPTMRRSLCSITAILSLRL